ncbi:MAG: extracellular solute-binding protein [Candidatus Doudnabacteria bacterium]|nr:extracellular solute-binding protein [Candidatus Doudnabacteria bacterium]
MVQKNKNIFHNFTKIIAIVLSIAFLSAGCGGGNKTTSSSKATLTIWKLFEDSQNMQPIFDAYRKKYPGVEIIYVKKNLQNYESDLLDALASGTGPDIFSIHNDWLPKYLDKITPVPENIYNLKDFKNTFVDAVVQDFTKDGKIYGTAMAVDSLALYYNKDLMGSSGIATPPKTWEELSNQTQRIKRSDGKGYFIRSGVAIGTNNNVNRAVDILYLTMLQQRAVPFNQDGTQAAFADDAEKNGNNYNPGQTALDFYTSFARPSSLNYNWNSKSDYSVDAFANGRAAYLYSYAYMRQTLLAKNPNLNFDVAPVPQPNLDDPSVNFANYWGEVVSKQSKNAAVAWDFLKFMTGKEALDKYYAQNKQPSSRRDLIELQANDPEIGVFASANLTAKSFYKPDQVKMDDIFGKMIDNVILNGVTVEEALTQAQQQANAIIRGGE